MKLKRLSIVLACLFTSVAIAQSAPVGTSGSGSSAAPDASASSLTSDPAAPGTAGSGSMGSGASGTGSTGSSGTVAFESLDKNGDGIISKDEAKKNRTLGRQWKQLDADKDGKLSRSEYEAGMAAGGTIPGSSSSGTNGGSSGSGNGSGGSTNAK